MSDTWYDRNMEKLDALRNRKLHLLEDDLEYISKIAEPGSEQELDSLASAMRIVNDLRWALNQEYLRLTGKMHK